MCTHGEFAVPNLILGILVLIHVVEKLIRAHQSHLNLTIGLPDIVVQPIGSILAFLVSFVLQAAAMITPRPHIPDVCRQSVVAVVLLDFFQSFSIRGQILIELFVRIVCTRLIHRINLTAVHTLPDTERRQTVIGRSPPPQLGRVESLYSCVSGQRRQCVRETETVGQHNVVSASNAQLMLIELVCIEHTVQNALCR